RLHPVSQEVIAGSIQWSIADAPAVMDFYRETNATGPRELSLDLSVWRSKDNDKMIGTDASLAGNREAAMKVLDALRRVGKPGKDTFGPMKYVDVQRQYDDGNRSATLHYVKGGFLREITPAFVEFLARDFEPTADMQLFMQNASGAVGDTAPGDTAFWNRKCVANL